MTTDRGRLHALTALIDNRVAAGYTLPPELLDAHALIRTASALPLPEHQPLHPDGAAGLAVADLLTGRTPDLGDLAERVHATERAGHRRQTAQMIYRAVVEQATNHTLVVAMDTADQTITEHLRPAFAAVLEQAARHVGTFTGQPLDHRALVTAPAKVRTAWAEMQTLADRHHLIRQARAQVNVAGLRTVQHDTSGEFAAFADPRALTGHPANAVTRAPRVETPSDPVDLMLWLAGPAAPARPWLPTVDEQDAAWLRTYSEGIDRRRTAAALAESVGARGSFLVGPTAA